VTKSDPSPTAGQGIPARQQFNTVLPGGTLFASQGCDQNIHLYQGEPAYRIEPFDLGSTISSR
jgi:hypothetical protein